MTDPSIPVPGRFGAILLSHISLLGSRRAPLVLAFAAFAIALPAVWSGYYQDDHLIRLRFQGFPGLSGVQGKLLDTCVFSDGNPEQNRARMECGFLPWWTPSDWKIAFWRPLTGLTQYADWKLFGDRAWVMHLHNLLWYALLVFVLVGLYRRMFKSTWVAGLAGLLYLLDPNHALAVGWIATRNAMLSSVFMVLVICFHDRWRRDQSRVSMCLAWIMLAVGLTGSEATVSAGAYLFAYALFVDRGPLCRRIAGLLPYLLIVVVWRMVYQHLGYGVAQTMLYTDPVVQPRAFLGDLFHHLPLLFFCQFITTDPSVYNFIPSAPVFYAIWTSFVLVLLLVARVLWPLLKEDATARFWALGMVLSALPVCTTIPQGRELMNPGIGATALIALFLGRHFMGERERTPGGQRLAKAFVGVWLALHVVVAAVAMPISSYSAVVMPEQAARRLNAGAPNDAKMKGDTLLLVYAPADLLGSTLPIMRAAMGENVPKHCRTLTAGIHSIDISRRDERTLVFDMDDTLLTRPFCMVFRDPAASPMKAGDIVRLSGFEANVEAVTGDGRPTRVTFRFEVPLEDPSLRWVVFKDGTYVPFAVPKIGESVHVQGPDFGELARWFLGA
jgi:hypothetical protein